MKKENVMTKIISCSVATYYLWKRNKRPVIVLLEKYFSNEELIEFLETGKINKMENTLIENTLNDKRINELLEIEQKYKTIKKVMELK